MRAARKGFTIIELLVVLVVVGILSAIAIAKFAGLKEQSYIASMKADLRNLAVYQMNYHVETLSFFPGDGSAQGFVGTPGVTISATVASGPPPTWAATATHASTTRTCSISTTGPSGWDIVCN